MKKIISKLVYGRILKNLKTAEKENVQMAVHYFDQLPWVLQKSMIRGAKRHPHAKTLRQEYLDVILRNSYYKKIDKNSMLDLLRDLNLPELASYQEKIVVEHHLQSKNYRQVFSHKH